MAGTSIRKNTKSYKALEAYFYRLKQEIGLEAMMKIKAAQLKTKPTDTHDPEYDAELQIYNLVKNGDNNRLGGIIRDIKKDMGK